MEACHHSNSRRFHCVCGTTTDWMRGEVVQACLKCRRIHRRGPGGPKKTVKNCSGVEPAVRFSQAVNYARNEFLRAMYQMGFITNREGLMELRDHNTPRSKYEGFTSNLSEHFGGKGVL